VTTHYEMLWDCSSCGTTKLLGKTHRRCPNCGAPQDPGKRYFPAPGEEVAAEGHVFVGADWHCAACTTPNSKAAQFCCNCGNPRDGNASVKLVGEPAPVAAKTSKPGRGKLYVAAALAAAVAVMGTCAVCWQKDEVVAVEAHRWTRDIDVETLAPRADSAWCDSMPSGAYNVSRSREQRGTRDIPDGETCHDKNVDNGDGTFHKENVCTTRYRHEPVYDDKCRFTIDRWDRSRTAHAEGRGLSPGPQWPAVRLGRTGNCLGCEREGPRREQLLVDVIDPKNKRVTCDVDTNRWRALVDGARVKMKVRVVTGGAVCSTLRPR
jgi:hypothetical protein